MILFKKIRTKFLVPILVLQFIALSILGYIGYSFSSNLLRTRSESEFRTTINSVYSSIDLELTSRIAKIEQLAADPVFIKFSAAKQYKSDADVAIYNFQKGNGLTLGEPAIGDAVSYPVGLLANEGNRKILNDGLFPSVEYVGLNGLVKLHVYLGGSNDEDFSSEDMTKLDRSSIKAFNAAKEGKVFVSRPELSKIYLREYQPITFENKGVIKEEDLITIAVPHRIGKTIKGVFLVTTSPDLITNALTNVSTNFLLLISDNDNVVFGERGDHEIMTGLPKDFILQTAKLNTDTAESLDGYLVMHKDIPTANWSTLIVGNEKSIYGAVWNLRNNVILIIVLSLAIMVVVVFFTIRKLLSPVIKLTKASNRIANGELGVVITKTSDDEIGILTNSFNKMSTATKEAHGQLEKQNLRLSRMNFVRKQLLSIISHELRTPLTAVIGFYELLSDEVSATKIPSDPKEFMELFENLGRSIDRCRALIERLTKTSSILAGEIRSEEEVIEECNLGEVILSTANEMQRFASERSINIVYPEDAKIILACPAGALKLVLEEALSNAIKYSPDGEKIEIEASANDKFTNISVRDRGTGIGSEYIEDVVEPFFEIQDADFHSTGRYASRGGGLGLGLTIILSVIRQYKGFLKIESPPDGGTLVIMSIPTSL